MSIVFCAILWLTNYLHFCQCILLAPVLHINNLEEILQETVSSKKYICQRQYTKYISG